MKFKLEKHGAFKPTRNSNLYSHTFLTNVLRFFLVVIVIWGEYGQFIWDISSCKWPSLTSSSLEDPAHVLLVADPQVQHPALVHKGSNWSGTIRQFIFDTNLRKSWLATKRLKPHAVIFLGDMLANGKLACNEEEYAQVVRKFKHIFTLDPIVQVYHIPGNNDVGMGLYKSPSNSIRDYYQKMIGPFNQHFEIKNHSFIGLDAPGLVDEDYLRSARGFSYEQWVSLERGPLSFVRQNAGKPGPSILLSHIPLARIDRADCGALREKGTIRQGVGHGYQNTLGKRTTQFLLETLQPDIVFSADDRDYCDILHHESSQMIKTREVTVKSFSLSVHIRKPGFQLLSLVDPSSRVSDDEPSFADTPCWLPDQFGIYTYLYFPSLALSFIALFVYNLKRGTRRRPGPISLHSSPNSSGRNTPSLPASGYESPLWTATWSPSQKTLYEPSLRETSVGGSSMSTTRASSRPASPPVGDSLHRGDDDEDIMYPTQYASRRHISIDEEWTHGGKGKVGEEEEVIEWASGSPILSQFISTPRPAPFSKERQSWSWSFVAGGRRRRITVRMPSMDDGQEIVRMLRAEEAAFKSRQGLLRCTLWDAVGVLWPPFLTLILIAWWT